MTCGIKILAEVETTMTTLLNMLTEEIINNRLQE
jgi:hypothetical protein